MKPADKLTDKMLVREYKRIVNKFYKEASGGTQFGVDAPTAMVLWPKEETRRRELMKEGKKRGL